MTYIVEGTFAHRLPQWAAAIAAKGVDAALHIALFVDGTLRKVCKPHPKPSKLPPGISYWALQQVLFSGHKWFHGLKYQGVTAPNGIMLDCFGPKVGTYSDTEALSQSGVTARLIQLTFGGILYSIYGDGAYALMNQFFCPFRNPVAGSPQALFNRRMAAVRVSQEWSFGITTNTFQAIDFARWQRTFLTYPGDQYRVATFLTNCISCIRGQRVTCHLTTFV